MAVAAGVVIGATTLSVRDPRTSAYLPCPLHAVTGMWCPGCGATRAFGDLVRGDLPSAMSSNVVAVVLLGVGVLTWGLWVRSRIRGTALATPPVWVIASAVVAVAAFTVVRNIPAGSWLAP